MRYPLISLAAAGGLLAALAVPAFNMETGTNGVSTLPDGLQSKAAFEILDEQFSAGEADPARIVIHGDIGSQRVQSAIDTLIALMASDREGTFGEPRELEVNASNSIALLEVPLSGEATGQPAEEAVMRLRGQYVPEAFANDAIAEVAVAGTTAYNLDVFATDRNAAGIVFPFVLGMSFILLMLVFRSIIVPVKAILLNLLSVGATYGLMVLVFQEGVGEVIGLFPQSGVIESGLLLFLFTILFGLSMDYHVFLLSRIRERFDATGDNAGSVAFGIRSTGRLITGAALIMVAVFWGFAAGDLIALQQMGFGIGTAILLDATIVRMVLVPAAMKLLGRWNWYLPGWMSWLPDVRVERSKTATVVSMPAAHAAAGGD
jgi:RND superfamily putative drug exporter